MMFSIIYDEVYKKYRIRPSGRLTVDELLTVIASYPSYKLANQALKSLSRKAKNEAR